MIVLRSRFAAVITGDRAIESRKPPFQDRISDLVMRCDCERLGFSVPLPIRRFIGALAGAAYPSVPAAGLNLITASLAGSHAATPSDRR
jgi:hypothetical protein